MTLFKVMNLENEKKLISIALLNTNLYLNSEKYKSVNIGNTAIIICLNNKLKIDLSK